jgi:hypothetical protein
MLVSPIFLSRQQRWLRWLPISMVPLAMLWAGPLAGLVGGLVAAYLVQALLDRRKPIPDIWYSLPPADADLYGHERPEPRHVGALGEIAMGGPEFWSVLLPDGAQLDGVCSEVLALDDGALQIALLRRRSGMALIAYQPQAQRIDSVEHLDAGAIFDLAARDPAQAAWKVRAALGQGADTTWLHQQYGLWVDRALPPAPERLERRLPRGRLLEARLLLPADLRGARDPHALLGCAPYMLLLDGVDTGRHVLALDDVFESRDGDCVALRGVLLEGERVRGGVWHLWRDGRWHAVDSSTVDARTAGGGEAFSLLIDALDGQGLLRCRVRSDAMGQRAKPRLPSAVHLRVSWLAEPLLLSPADAVFTVQVPANQRGAGA